MPKETQVTPAEYKLVFEDHKIGARVMEDLLARFSHQKGRGTGIDRVLDAHEYLGQRRVIEFIVMRINQANGVNDDVDTETPAAE